MAGALEPDLEHEVVQCQVEHWSEPIVPSSGPRVGTTHVTVAITNAKATYRQSQCQSLSASSHNTATTSNDWHLEGRASGD
jgi:hypothetical protein